MEGTVHSCVCPLSATTYPGHFGMKGKSKYENGPMISPSVDQCDADLFVNCGIVITGVSRYTLSYCR